MNKQKWTLMVYMAGDNSLTTDLAYALEELRNVARDTRDFLNIYVYFDGISPDVPTLYCDFSPKPTLPGVDPEPEYFQSWRVKDKLVPVKEEFNENSAAVTNIINFVNWCVERDRDKGEASNLNAFILSGHSFGFLNWGLFKDEKANYYMTHRKLRYALDRITASEVKLEKTARADEEAHRLKTGRRWSSKYRKSRKKVILGRKIDLLGFDSCVMSTIEIASQFRRFATTMVASEGSIPLAGWNYATILARQIEKRHDKSKLKGIDLTLDPAATAISFVDEFVKQQGNYALADVSVDMSAWNLQRLKGLEDSFGELAVALRKGLRSRDKKIRHHVKRGITISHAECQTFMFEQHVDLGDFCGILAKELKRIQNDFAFGSPSQIVRIRKACRSVIKNIRKCILLNGYAGGDFQFATGVSAFLPLSWASYSAAATDYEDLDFISGTHAGRRWNEMLQTFLGELTFRCPKGLSKPDGEGRFKGGEVFFTSFILGDRDEEMLDDCLMIGDAGGFGGWAGGKQPPNGTRQPPNGTRQPPNDPRRMDEMSVFLTRFLRLKNFRFDWNRAGFRSIWVDFLAESSVSTPTMTAVKIPASRPIGKKILGTKNLLLTANGVTLPPARKLYADIVVTVFYLGDKSQVDALGGLLPKIIEASENVDADSRRRLHELIGQVIDIAGPLKDTNKTLAELNTTYKNTVPLAEM